MTGIQDCGIDPIAHKRGSDLQVGDKVSVWWKPKGAMIKEIRPYKSSLSHLFPEGASVGHFEKNPSPMAPKDYAPMVIDYGHHYPIMP